MNVCHQIHLMSNICIGFYQSVNNALHSSISLWRNWDFRINSQQFMVERGGAEAGKLIFKILPDFRQGCDILGKPIAKSADIKAGSARKYREPSA